MSKIVKFAVTLALALTSWGTSADYTKDLNSIPSYCQEGVTWCGAAVGEMILEGYPNGGNYVYAQSFIMARIQAHKDDTLVARKKWATDPDALRDTLNELGNEAGVNWRSQGESSPNALTFDVLYSMANTDFPAAALIFFGLHWVTVEKFITDVDPRNQNQVVLKKIGIVNPLKSPCPFSGYGGMRSVMDGSTWLTSYLYLNSPVSVVGSKWRGKFVAVTEGDAAPPGDANAEMQRTSGAIVSIGAAIEFAQNALNGEDILKVAPYSVLHQIDPLNALLVNVDGNAYYIVPYGYKDNNISIGAIIVNAYSGQFQEASVFPKPIQFISKEDAVRLASTFVCKCNISNQNVASQLVFTPSGASFTRFLPVWQIAFDSEVVFVSQDGRVFRDLPEPVPGG